MNPGEDEATLDSGAETALGFSYSGNTDQSGRDAASTVEAASSRFPWEHAQFSSCVVGAAHGDSLPSSSLVMPREGSSSFPNTGLECSEPQAAPTVLESEIIAFGTPRCGFAFGKPLIAVKRSQTSAFPIKRLGTSVRRHWTSSAYPATNPPRATLIDTRIPESMKPHLTQHDLP